MLLPVAEEFLTADEPPRLLDWPHDPVAASGASSLAEARDRLAGLLQYRGVVGAGDDVTSRFAFDFRPASTRLYVDPCTGPHLTVVLEGFARQKRTSRAVGSTLTTLFAEGDWFETRESGGHDVRTFAVMDTWFATIPTRSVEALIQAHPEVSTRVLGGLTGALFTANDTSTGLALKDSAGRLASVLLVLEQRLGRRVAGVSYVEHNLSQSQLAEAAGCRRETANKVLMDFGRRGVLTVHGMTFALHDRDWLVRRAR